MEYTTERLLAMSPKDLGLHFNNCLRIGGLRGEQLANKILGLDVEIFIEGGLSEDNPITQKLHEIINSADATLLLIEAVNAGLPALAGIEPTIVAALGRRYSKVNTGTATAGAFVAVKMRHLGYVETKKGQMPEGSVAKSAAMWAPKETL